MTTTKKIHFTKCPDCVGGVYTDGTGMHKEDCVFCSKRGWNGVSDDAKDALYDLHDFAARITAGPVEYFVASTFLRTVEEYGVEARHLNLRDDSFAKLIRTAEVRTAKGILEILERDRSSVATRFELENRFYAFMKAKKLQLKDIGTTHGHLQELGLEMK